MTAAADVARQIAGLEEDLATDDAELEERRAREVELGRAIARGMTGRGDVSDLQREQHEIKCLTNKREAAMGVLRVLREAQDELAAEQRAAVALAERQRAAETSIAELHEAARTAAAIEEATAALIALVGTLREHERRASTTAIDALTDDRERVYIASAVANLCPELANLAEFLNGRGGGGSIEMLHMSGSGAQVAARVAQVSHRIRQAFGLTDDTLTSST